MKKFLFNKLGLSTTLWIVIGLVIAIMSLLVILGFQIGISDVIDRLLGRVP